MNTKFLKYKQLLETFPDCPNSDFKPVNGDFYRWVHDGGTHPNDFLPLNIINDPPARILDNTDKYCKGYGLSMFDSETNASKTYQSGYKKSRNKESFIEEKGTLIATISINEEDGIADEPSKKGHFTFHEYDHCDFTKSIIEFFNIFDEYGAFSIQ